jgi:hypothetical protein
MERTLQALRDVGRFDVLRLLGEGKLRLADVHEDYQRDPAALQQKPAREAGAGHRCRCPSRRGV